MPLDSRTKSLNLSFKEKDPQDVLKHALTQLGQASLVSSFGADSVALLHMAAQIDRNVHVIFIDTELLFPETLTYQQQVADSLGLTNVEVIRASRAAVFEHDNENLLHLHDHDACCHLRKTAPLQKALAGVDTWITGHKQVLNGERAPLNFFDVDRPLGELPRIKVAPLAYWDRGDTDKYLTENSLPRHPLVAQGYPSLGCTPCTTRNSDGGALRANRWIDPRKNETEIHPKNQPSARLARAS